LAFLCRKALRENGLKNFEKSENFVGVVALVVVGAVGLVVGGAVALVVVGAVGLVVGGAVGLVACK
jgi:hypothetical protein